MSEKRFEKIYKHIEEAHMKFKRKLEEISKRAEKILGELKGKARSSR